MITLRNYRASDAAALGELFFESVQVGAASAYDERQRMAWARAAPQGEAWSRRLRQSVSLVAEEEQGLAGFMTLREDGVLDLAYVRSDRMGQGVAKALYDELLRRAAKLGLKKLTTHASLLARPFFERQGWSVVAQKQPVLGGVALTNFLMEHDIDSPSK